MRLIFYVLAALLLTVPSTSGVPFILAAAITTIAPFVYNNVVNNFDNIKCSLLGCCNDPWNHKHIQDLKQNLKSRLHGQHLVQNTAVRHIAGHVSSSSPPKALVLTLHGDTGVGKNFASSIIAESLYDDGMSSPFVHLISATKEFPHEGMLPFYQDQLKSWIEGNVTRCKRSMFIFDEVDKLPMGLLDVIKPYLDHYHNLGGVDYRNSIFLFLSNTGGSDIAQISLDHWRSGKTRESLALSDFENKLTLAELNSENKAGLRHSSIITSHLVTAFIPFLPLEKEHVRECVRDTLVQGQNFRQKYRVRSEIPRQVVDNVLQELTFYPDTEKIYSSTGCKRVAEKVDFVMMDY